MGYQPAEVTVLLAVHVGNDVVPLKRHGACSDDVTQMREWLNRIFERLRFMPTQAQLAVAILPTATWRSTTAQRIAPCRGPVNQEHSGTDPLKQSLAKH